MVTLKKDDLDKFQPSKKFDDFQVVLLLNKKYIDQKAPGPTPGKWTKDLWGLVYKEFR